MNDINALAKLLGLDRLPEILLDTQEQRYMQGYLTGLATEESRQRGGVPVLPATAPLEPGKRVLLDGILAGMFSRTWAGEALAGIGQTDSAQAPSKVTVLWASQTGNAEAFAARCVEQLQAGGHSVTLASMDSVSPADLAQSTQLLVLTSTFGDGDPPDNASNLWQALQAESAPRLEQTRFAVLAFGDSNYDQFCGFGRKLEARLLSLGAQAMHARVDCEPEFEDVAQTWLKTVMTSLGNLEAAASKLHASAAQPALALAGADSAIEETQVKPKASGYSRQHPLRSRLVINQRLNASSSSKEIRQFGFDLADSGFSYEAGDALGVWPTNCAELVGSLLATLKLSPSIMVRIKQGQEDKEVPLVQALSHHYDIARITPDILKFTAERSQHPQLLALMAPAIVGAG